MCENIVKYRIEYLTVSCFNLLNLISLERGITVRSILDLIALLEIHLHQDEFRSRIVEECEFKCRAQGDKQILVLFRNACKATRTVR